METQQQIRFLSQIKRLFKCDEARIISFPGKLFLMIGEKKNTKDNKEACWVKNGSRYDFEYIDEKNIASGQNLKALMKSALEYKRLGKMTMMEFLNEQMVEAKK